MQKKERGSATAKWIDHWYTNKTSKAQMTTSNWNVKISIQIYNTEIRYDGTMFNLKSTILSWTLSNLNVYMMSESLHIKTESGSNVP